MRRKIEIEFSEWVENKIPKPIVLRGARQVGKSYVVREVARLHKMKLFEINFEKNPGLGRLFLEKNVAKILRALSIEFNDQILPGKSILFLDEIQAIPEAIATLRYFYEDQKGLHVVAAGSLLEFALSDGQFSAPVGRIEYWHMFPMTFKEFLLALKQKQIIKLMEEFTLNDIQKLKITETEHKKMLNFYEKYLIVGGMPEALQAFVDGNDNYVDRIKESLLSVYIDDFHKYRNRIPFERLNKIFQIAPGTIGQKFIYSHVDAEEKAQALGQALTLLCLAKIFYKVFHSTCAGIPLKAQINEKFFKLIMLDVGLLQKILGISFNQNSNLANTNILYEGALAEQFIGQHLLCRKKVYEDPQLHYWARDVGHSKAEVDYVIEHQGQIVPIEVKSGSVKSLKSMQMFMLEKKIHWGIRFDNNLPSISEFKTALSIENKKIKLFSLPLYLVEEIPRLFESFY